MRKTNFKKLNEMFLDRWSPRAFQDKKISDEDILTLFESARWSPSCYNEQPWFFLYAKERKDLDKFQEILVDANRQWAAKAPLMIILFANKFFKKDGAPNKWAEFDAGSAWMALSLQARKMGYYTHGMAGFKEKKAYEITGVDPKEFKAICAIVVGTKGDDNDLPSELKKIEHPNERKGLDKICKEFIS